MRIEADLNLRQGHAACESEAPAVFAVPKHGKVTILDPTPAPALRTVVNTTRASLASVLPSRGSCGSSC